MSAGLVAHLSDLHLGADATRLDVARRLVAALFAAQVAYVVVTGDVTHRGRPEELALFQQLFAPWLAEGRVTLVPGNHDRVGPAVGERFMDGRRVDVVRAGGLHLVRVDTTGPHNHSYWQCQGVLTHGQLDDIERAVDAARPGDAVWVLMHHHPLPLATESLGERLASRLGTGRLAELSLGAALLHRLQGRADRVLHGHRHRPSAHTLGAPERPLYVSNAGSSLELGRVPLYALGAAAPLAPHWLPFTETPAAPRSSAQELRTALGETLRGWRHAAVAHPGLSAPARRGSGTRRPSAAARRDAW